jgi:hypothetical protein
MEIRFNDEVMPFCLEDECWDKAGMDGFEPGEPHYTPLDQESLMIVDLRDIKPRVRKQGFNRKRLLRILKGYRKQSGIPPIRVAENRDGAQPYRLIDGFHRFFSSAAAGFTHIPAVLEEKT